MIPKRRGKFCGIYSSLQFKIDRGTANLDVLLRMNQPAYSCRVQGFPTVPRFAESQSDVVGLVTRIN